MAIKHCIEAIICHFLPGSNFHPSETHFGLKNCHFKWSHAKLDVGHLYLLLVMWEDQILTHIVAPLWFAILTCCSGLFGLWDFDIQTKVNFHLHSTKWPQINEKVWNFDFQWYLAFDLAFMTFTGLFQFFWDPWCLRSPVICSSHISEHYFIKNSFCLRFPISDHCAPLRGDWGGWLLKKKCRTTFFT